MISTKSDAVSYIENQTWSTTRLGLERTKILLELLGNPQDKLKFIHVAGSNGKGSTSSMIYTLLLESGFKAGLYTSPYLVDFSEQIAFCGEYISEEDLIELTAQIAPIADAMSDHPSRFEILTAISMLYFKKRKADIVVLEVGMGGKLDSTNVIPAPICSVITNIGMEHCQYLGDTIEKIADTKAGIIKRNSSVVCYDLQPDVKDIIQKRAYEKNCRFLSADFSQISNIRLDIDKSSFNYKRYDFGQLDLRLLGLHQIKNACVVLDVVSEINHYFGMEKIKYEHIKKAFLSVHWPARFEILSHDPLFILDGAHNPQCVEALKVSLDSICGDKKFLVMTGMLEDKDKDGMILPILPFAKRIMTLTPNSERGMRAEDLREKIQSLSGDMEVISYSDTKEAILYAIESGEDVLCFGSLYMAGDIIKYFGHIKKAHQRRQASKKLREITKEEKIVFDKRITDLLTKNENVKKANIIMSFVSDGYEVDLSAFDNWARENKKNICYPKTVDEENMEAYIVDSSEKLMVGRYGIKEPIVSESRYVSPSDIDLIIVPALAFDKEGHRLGRGKGYYDRFLKRTFANTIMVVYRVQELSTVYTDHLDEKIECVIS